jgi:hypothetical protein
MAKAKRRTAKESECGTAMMEVDNPLWSRDHYGRIDNPRRIMAMVSLRESAITTMHAREVIDDAQAAAAIRFRRNWEAMGAKGAGAIDYSKEPVDGGGIVETVLDRHLIAGRELHACRLVLGVRGYRLVSQVCGEGHQVSELFPEKRAQMSAMDALRGHLDDLAELWNIKMRTDRCAKIA